jgi:dolichol-phosphate mannosyltransferase
MNTVSVILPTYNETDNIIPLISAIKKHVKNLKEILVVDDNSPDGTADRAASWVKTHPKGMVRLIRRMKNHGLTQSIQEGINQSKGAIIVWMDADFSMPPADINWLVTEIQNGADLVAGSRFVTGGKKKTTAEKERWYNIWASVIANSFMHTIFGYDFNDYTSGFIAVKKDVILSLPLRGSYGEYCIDMIVRAFARGYRIREIPYICMPRIRGTSKTAPTVSILITRYFQYSMMVLRLLWETKILKKTQ